MIPRTLYKYQAITVQTLENLKTGSLWFSPPSAFNDPFDCALQVVAPDLSEADAERALTWVRSHVPTEQQAQLYPLLQPNTEFRQIVADITRQTFETQRSSELEKYGLACLSAKNDDLLMWGHYADGHRGFCLEFDTSKEPFTHACQVSYSSTVPLFSPVDVLEGDVDKIVETLILTKHSCWSYEREWRVPNKASRTAVNYHGSALTGVYFGAKMPNVQREIVALLLRDAPTKLYSMSIEPGSFAMASHAIAPPPFK